MGEPRSQSYAEYVNPHCHQHQPLISLLNMTNRIVGPGLPRNTPYNPNTRYTTSSFQRPRPQMLTPAASAYTTQTILENTNTAKSDTIWREALAPLPATKQRPGFKIGFFEQGIITGGLLTLSSLVATVSTLGYYTWVYVRMRG